MKSTSSGGHDPIDPEHILNIWVAPICNGVIGFATFPGEPFETDGVVIDPSAFGLGGTSMAPFNLGRTATHEVGHYFNLFHIWGDDSNPGDGIDDCSGTDLCGILLIRNVRISDVLHFRTSHAAMALQVICL